MKKIGILGGVGWPSTIEYYKSICSISQSYWEERGHSTPLPTPEIAIESLNMNFTVNNRGSDATSSWDVWDRYFQMALQKLEDGGAELILVASVTPHARLEVISQRLKVPVLSIYDAIGQFCVSSGIDNILVLGTLPTMTSLAFIKGVSKFGVNAFYPPRTLQSNVVSIIEDLYHDRVDGLDASVESIVEKSYPLEGKGEFAACLGCTELPTAFRAIPTKPVFTKNRVIYLNSTVIHSLSAFQACLE